MYFVTSLMKNIECNYKPISSKYLKKGRIMHIIKKYLIIITTISKRNDNQQSFRVYKHINETKCKKTLVLIITEKKHLMLTIRSINFEFS